MCRHRRMDYQTVLTDGGGEFSKYVLVAATQCRGRSLVDGSGCPRFVCELLEHMAQRARRAHLLGEHKAQ